MLITDTACRFIGFNETPKMADDSMEIAPGSYRQYKNDTAAFLTWLQQVAEACAYEVCLSPTTQARP